MCVSSANQNDTIVWFVTAKVWIMSGKALDPDRNEDLRRAVASMLAEEFDGNKTALAKALKRDHADAGGSTTGAFVRFLAFSVLVLGSGRSGRSRVI